MGARRVGPRVWKIEAMVSLGPARVEKWTSFHTTRSLAITGDSGSHQDGEKIDPDKQDLVCFVKSN